MSDDLMPKLPKNLAKPRMTRINEENDNLISVESNLRITLNYFLELEGDDEFGLDDLEVSKNNDVAKRTFKFY